MFSSLPEYLREKLSLCGHPKGGPDLQAGRATEKSWFLVTTKWQHLKEPHVECSAGVIVSRTSQSRDGCYWGRGDAKPCYDGGDATLPRHCSSWKSIGRKGETGLYPTARSWLSQESTMQNVLSTFPKASELQMETSDFFFPFAI